MKPKKSQPASVDRGFTQVPNSVIKDVSLSRGARLLYVILSSYSWDKDFCYPAQETLAREIGLTDRQVRSLLKELEAAGYIGIRKRGYESPNVYILKVLPPGKKYRKRYDELFGEREK